MFYDISICNKGNGYVCLTRRDIIMLVVNHYKTACSYHTKSLTGYSRYQSYNSKNSITKQIVMIQVCNRYNIAVSNNSSL